MRGHRHHQQQRQISGWRRRPHQSSSSPPTPLDFLFAILLLQLQCTTCLRDMELTIPPAVTIGQDVQLECHYHLQGEDLYTLKLYKGRHEFLQLVPSKTPMIKTFPLKGLDVDLQNIRLNGSGLSVHGLSVTLSSVNLFTSGLYGCEASADKSFHTELVRKRMTVVVKPVSRPVVSGFRSTYRVGDTVEASCVVTDSFPAANITWFVSGQRVTSKSPTPSAKSPLVTQNSSASPTTGLRRTESRLRLPVRARHFRRGRMVAKCVASVLTMHWQSRDAVAREEKPSTMQAKQKDGEDEDEEKKEEEKEDGNSKVAGVKKHLTGVATGSHNLSGPLILFATLLALTFQVSSRYLKSSLPAES